MKLRPYQQECLDKIDEKLAQHQSTLVVCPTGGGKTIIFANAIKRRLANGGRAMVIAHREELIQQAADKISTVTGERPDIEMGSDRADLHIFRKNKVVVASKDSLHHKRLSRFKPEDFELLITDEAHRSVARSYKRVYDHFLKNPKCKHLGVTATPDRADEIALGQVFESVAFDYEILDAIHDGWLVDIRSQYVAVGGLDFSGVRTTAGDLDQGQLAQIMEDESIAHQTVSPMLELAGKKKTLVFGVSIAHAEKIKEIIERHKPGSAMFVSGYTPTDERRRILRGHRDGEFQFLVNVGVLTEGYDDPTIEVVAVARPTKSRALYAQMVGRGTRPLPGIVDGIDDAAGRIHAIGQSTKSCLEVLDFEGNNGRHKLCSSVDILGGKMSEAVLARAKKKIKEASDRGESCDLRDAIEEAEADIRREADRARRRAIKAKAEYAVEEVDPFNVYGTELSRPREWSTVRPPSEKQIATLRKFGIDTKDISFHEASRLIGDAFARVRAGQCTPKQGKVLERYGFPSTLSMDQARGIIDQVAAQGWPSPASFKLKAPRREAVAS